MRSHLPLAAVVATLLTAATLSTLVEGVRWFVEVLVTVGAVAAATAAARRLSRHPGVALAAGLVAWLLVLTWLYARAEAWWGVLPTVATTGELIAVAAAGADLVATVAPPAPAEAGIRLLVSAGVGAVVLVVDTVAVGLRQPAVAGLPLLAVYLVPAALAPGGLDWYWFVLAGAGYLVLVAADAGERVGRWGRVLDGDGGGPAPLAATGRRVGALALAGAVVVPTVVPGLGEALHLGSGTGDGPGQGGRISVVNPILDLRENLTAPRDDTVLTYTTTGTPQPLRLVTNDLYDGEQWRPRLEPLPRSDTAAGGLPAPPGLSDEVTAQGQRFRITVQGLESVWLPVPYPTTRVDVMGPWLYDDTLNVLGDGVSTSPGMSYDAFYLEVTPTPEQLLDAPPPPADVVARWGTPPADLPASVAATAAEVAGDGTPYEQAVRLQQWFRNEGGFRYSLTAPAADSASALADFLAQRAGYCVHFASSMAVMARTLGIPSRVAVGFLPGQRQPDGSYAVSVRDAHAWPELYFAGVGWVRFEPTPSTRTGSLPSWAAPPPSVVADRDPTDLPTSAPPPEQGGASTSAADDAAAAAGTSLAQVLAAVPWRAVSGVLLALALAGAPLVTSRVVRRSRWRSAARSPDPGAGPEAAWTTLRESAADLGLDADGPLTPRQLGRRLGEHLDDAGRQALDAVVAVVERARYARDGGTAGVATLRRDVRAVERALHAGVGRGVRWRARLLPGSGVAHLRTGLVRAGTAADAAERRLAGRLRALRTRGPRGDGPSAPRAAA